jgi:GNAT superfamily N-acetyltransferase
MSAFAVGGAWQIREARPEEFELLRALEDEADSLFAQVGIGPFAQSEEENHLAQAAVVLVAGDPPLGFACVELVDGAAHVWQLAVDPSVGRRGIGTALIGAVFDWARSHHHLAVTLTTFRDVPWNGPFYARLGFDALDERELTPGLAAIRAHERDIGDDDFGVRIAMRKQLEASATR